MYEIIDQWWPEQHRPEVDAPPRLVYDLESRLRGAHIDELPELVRDFFRQAGAEVLSVAPEDFTAALRDALGEALGDAPRAAPESA